MSSRTLIILQGLPGPGKSAWAHDKLASLPPGTAKIHSYRDYFPVGYDDSEVSMRQFWMMEAFVKMVKSGIETIIVDDVNAAMMCWMYYYGRLGIENGYTVETVLVGSLDAEAQAACIEFDPTERFIIKYRVEHIEKVMALQLKEELPTMGCRMDTAYVKHLLGMVENIVDNPPLTL